METVHCFTDPDVSNGIKGAFHGGLATLAGACGIYNFSAWRTERRAPKPDVNRKRHLFWNWVLYVCVVLFEGYQINRHAGR